MKPSSFVCAMGFVPDEPLGRSATILRLLEDCGEILLG